MLGCGSPCRPTGVSRGLPEALTLYRVNAGGFSANLEQQYAAWERVLTKTAVTHPGFIPRWGPKASAYQLRYLARRAIRQRQPGLAVRLLHQSLACHVRILLEEPLRTLITLGAAYLLWLLPTWLYRRMDPA